MVLPRYLAMTRNEFHNSLRLPPYVAWMACHFSPYGTGLTNLPPELPPNAMVILNDRIPMGRHDPVRILEQLRQLTPTNLLLDLQRPPEAESMALVQAITEALPCPIGVTEAFANHLNCAVFLPFPPPDTPLEDYLQPWRTREIWLEAELNAMTYTVTEQGSCPGGLYTIPPRGQTDPDLCCHYHLSRFPDRTEFSLWRTESDVNALLTKAADYGVTKAVGLWQEFTGGTP